ncbi:MAG: type II toxin-antitoxin system Phd/YefM family antitoxin [Kiritimatiellae bacterium]|jgi:hypothetical protein|nr:type II toxin-antitoxin system Phd/YefM family antitoxin [Kiritimatiellia bacterium]
MNASVIDLRYKMNDVLKALDRNEDVTILYHGKVKGVISSHANTTSEKITEHPFYNMSNTETSVDEEMTQLRGGRFNAL